LKNYQLFLRFIVIYFFRLVIHWSYTE